MEKHLVMERIIIKINNLTKKISLKILITAYGLEQTPTRKPNICDDLEKYLRDGNLTLNQKRKQKSLWQKCS